MRRLVASGVPVELAGAIAEACYPLSNPAESLLSRRPLVDRRQAARSTEALLQGYVDLDEHCSYVFGLGATRLSSDLLGVRVTDHETSGDAIQSPSTPEPEARWVGDVSASDSGQERWSPRGTSLERVIAVDCPEGEESNEEPGERRWYLDGRLHRVLGPAVELADGDSYWCLFGEMVEYDSTLASCLAMSHHFRDISADLAFDQMTRLTNIEDHAWVARVLLANPSPGLDTDFRCWLSLFAQFDIARRPEAPMDPSSLAALGIFEQDGYVAPDAS